MKFTNKYENVTVKFVTDTMKAMLLEFGTTYENVGDVALQMWLPKWAVKLNQYLGMNQYGEYEKNQPVDLGIQEIEEFEYKVFNKELDIEEKVDFKKLMELINKGSN